jgi:hypothetical protein
MVELDDARAMERSVARPRPVLYLLVIFASLVGAFVYHMREAGIFACPASHYGPESYLGYCNGSAYGDYDHGAIWFGLEPEVREAAAAADVLFLGNSRMQFGFSAPSVERWFADRGTSYYLLGFSDNETFRFTQPLLASLRPQARAYVISVDKFFFDDPSPPGGQVMHEPDARARWRAKQVWQAPHRLICGVIPGLCGNAVVFFREREHGTWQFDGSRGIKYAAAPIEADRPVYVKGNPRLVETVTANARAFIAGLGVDPSCVVLTYVPSTENNRLLANTIAEAVGLPLIAPQGEGLNTFDTSHLDTPSAEVFSAAFLEEAGPRLQQCLGMEARR